MPPAVPFSETVISREEAIKLWNELDAMGTMVIEGFYGFTMGAEEPQFVGGCHCCGCCCTILNAARLAPLDETIQRSNYRVVKDYDKCHSCGECVRRCQFYAHTFDKATDAKPVYHRDKCVGCGACGMGCPTECAPPRARVRGGVVPGAVELPGMGGAAPGVPGGPGIHEGREVRQRRRWLAAGLVAVLSLASAGGVSAQSPEADKPPKVAADQATALAKQQQNPIASLISVPLQGNWDFGLGDRDATGTLFNFQPVDALRDHPEHERRPPGDHAPDLPTRQRRRPRRTASATS